MKSFFMTWAAFVFLLLFFSDLNHWDLLGFLDSPGGGYGGSSGGYRSYGGGGGYHK